MHQSVVEDRACAPWKPDKCRIRQVVQAELLEARKRMSFGQGQLDLLDADYTFLNERLARHYGIPDVYGSEFRKITVADGIRGGLLGQGGILTATSYPNRTSPVLRGPSSIGNPCSRSLWVSLSTISSEPTEMAR